MLPTLGSGDRDGLTDVNSLCFVDSSCASHVKTDVSLTDSVSVELVIVTGSLWHTAALVAVRQMQEYPAAAAAQM